VLDLDLAGTGAPTSTSASCIFSGPHFVDQDGLRHCCSLEFLAPLHGALSPWSIVPAFPAPVSVAAKRKVHVSAPFVPVVAAALATPGLSVHVKAVARRLSERQGVLPARHLARNRAALEHGLPARRADAVTERPGRCACSPAASWSRVRSKAYQSLRFGQAGLLDICLHPGFAQNRCSISPTSMATSPFDDVGRARELATGS